MRATDLETLSALALIAALSVFLGTAPARAGGACVTDQERVACIEDAILETRTFSQGELAAIDLNGDGQVDVADLVCFHNDCFRRANFETLDQSVAETVGTVTARVLFDEPVTGQFFWTWTDDSTATAGADYQQVGGGTQSLTGATQVVISVPIVNDGVTGEVPESVVLQIEPGAGYQVGGMNRHTIFIDDDDVVWRGLLETGTGKVPLAIAIGDDGTGIAAEITSDGLGSFPEGTWAATGVVMAPGTFSASIAPIAMDADTTDLGEAFTRTFTFVAVQEGSCRSDPGTPACTSDDDCTNGVCALEQIVSADIIRGSYTETVTFPTTPHLNRMVTGMFTLSRGNPRGLFDVPLEDVRRAGN